MSRLTQSMILFLLGGAVLRITMLSTTYLNYVKPGFRPFLIAAGAVVFVLGVIGVIQEWRGAAGPDHAADSSNHHEGHDHGHAPRVAWLLVLPVFAIFLISPPALGAFSAKSEEATAQMPVAALDAYSALPAGKVTEMTLGEFIGRAWGDSSMSLTGRQVKLTGFVVKSVKKKDRWYVARIQIACCAADGIALKVAVLGQAMPEEDSWVEVIGTWREPKSGKTPVGMVAPELDAVSVAKIPAPVEPYE
ncbi:TIGR03943 family protein [Acrocarpospora phusangensis]|uniref:TIGR03943 family protein n=1 Tax=Acrocarpospora phusangensis TaxID=1070424 RepID=A0A919UJB0_9ACTN|nr:TIGR03943 family protein [Acrocarpospora phusangensis]GIH23626.1 TIGR03943 family protein [Acrocarpospora phusangensis]